MRALISVSLPSLTFNPNPYQAQRLGIETITSNECLRWDSLPPNQNPYQATSVALLGDWVLQDNAQPVLVGSLVFLSVPQIHSDQS